MFIEKIKSEGLAHLSYVLGSEGKAAVVDPRRDFDVYVEIAAANGCRITHVFETHRNEDLLSGAAALAAYTGAAVYHGPDAAGDVVYARTARDGDEFTIGKLCVRVLQTPGHTDDSLSFAVVDTASSDDAVGVFTGDALFIGDVGRTDFYPDRAREVAGRLFDSLRTILALGDQAVVYPAHGAGSVCGSGMADREVSTIGYERRNNPRLQISDRDAFIAEKLAEHHDKPPYFAHMEALNLSGADPLVYPLAPRPLTPPMLDTEMDGAVLVDVRTSAAFLGAHLPRSLSLPVGMLAAFGGWLLDPGDELVLVADSATEAREAALRLARIGYDRVLGFVEPTMPQWAAAGQRFATLPAVDAETVRRRAEERAEDWQLLDVRAEDEVRDGGTIAGARHVYVGELPARLGDLSKQRRYTVMCESGARATVAASVLGRAGFEDVDVFLGSMGAWRRAGHPLEEVTKNGP